MSLFQNESSCTTFHMRMSLTYLKIDLSRKTFSCEWFHTKTRCDTEAKGNPEMDYGLETSTILVADAKPQITTEEIDDPKTYLQPLKKRRSRRREQESKEYHHKRSH